MSDATRADVGRVVRVASSGVAVDTSEQERRRARWVMGVSAALVVILSAGTVTLDLGVICMLNWVPLIALLYGVGSFTLAGLTVRPKLAKGVVTVEGDVLRVDIEARQVHQAIPLADVTQGFREEPDFVHLATRAGESFLVRVPDDAAADQLLHACGVTAAARVLRVPLASAVARVPGGRLLTSLALVFGFLSTMLSLMAVGAVLRVDALPRNDTAVLALLALVVLSSPLLAFSYVLVRVLARREVTVGVDGLVFRGTFRRQVLPFTAVRRVTRDRRGVRIERTRGRDLVLTTLDGERGTLRTEATAVPPSEAETRRDALLQRIQSAMDLRDRSAAEPPGMDRLDRRGRPLSVWRAELARLLGESTDYRQTTLTAADLASVSADAAAPAERRIAAAVALSTTARDEARQRVRIAASACADEDLRRALESAAEGEIDEAALLRRERRA